jgi:hypothetical protein
VDLPARIGNYGTIASTFTVSIDENPDCPADARYKGVVLAMKPRGLVPMQSADGKRWKPVTDQHVITGDAFDSPNRAVSWKNGSDVSTLAGQPVRIRFVMKDADLYAFRFQPEDSTPPRKAA